MPLSSKVKHKVIEITDEKLGFLQQMSNDFHRVYAEAMGEYGEKELKLIDDTLSFGYKIIQTIGIVAGFGFTALGSVKTTGFFVLGEALFVTSIIYGVYQIKRIYATNLQAIQESSNQKSKVFQEKSQFFEEVIAGAVEERKMNAADFQQKLGAINAKLKSEFTTDSVKVSKDEGRFLNIIILLLTAGSLFLLASFFDFPPIGCQS